MELIFYKAKGDWLDWAIRWETWGPYSHCELRLEQHLTFSSSWRDKGVRFRDMAASSEKWDRLLIDLSEDEAEELILWCSKQSGAYDLWGIFGFIINKRVQDTTKWYCSEICSEGLNRNLRLDLPQHISPNRLYRQCVQMPGRFRPPADPLQPFVPTLRRSYLEPARELSRDILELPQHLQMFQMTKLMVDDPVTYAIVKALHSSYQGWG